MQENISGLHFSNETFQKLCPMLWFASDITLDAGAITEQDLKIIASHSMMSFTGLMALAETAGYHLMTDDVIAAAVKYNKIFKRSLETGSLSAYGHGSTENERTSQKAKGRRLWGAATEAAKRYARIHPSRGHQRTLRDVTSLAADLKRNFCKWFRELRQCKNISGEGLAVIIENLGHVGVTAELILESIDRSKVNGTVLDAMAKKSAVLKTNETKRLNFTKCDNLVDDKDFAGGLEEWKSFASKFQALKTLSLDNCAFMNPKKLKNAMSLTVPKPDSKPITIDDFGLSTFVEVHKECFKNKTPTEAGRPAVEVLINKALYPLCIEINLGTLTHGKSPEAAVVKSAVEIDTIKDMLNKTEDIFDCRHLDDDCIANYLIPHLRKMPFDVLTKRIKVLKDEIVTSMAKTYATANMITRAEDLDLLFNAIEPNGAVSMECIKKSVIPVVDATLFPFKRLVEKIGKGRIDDEFMVAVTKNRSVSKALEETGFDIKGCDKVTAKGCAEFVEECGKQNIKLDFHQLTSAVEKNKITDDFLKASSKNEYVLDSIKRATDLDLTGTDTTEKGIAEFIVSNVQNMETQKLINAIDKKNVGDGILKAMANNEHTRAKLKECDNLDLTGTSVTKNGVEEDLIPHVGGNLGVSKLLKALDKKHIDNRTLEIINTNESLVKSMKELDEPIDIKGTGIDAEGYEKHLVEHMTNCSVGNLINEDIPPEFVTDKVLKKLTPESIARQKSPIDLTKCKNITEEVFAEVIIKQSEEMSFDDLINSIDRSKVGDVFLKAAVQKQKVKDQMKTKKGIDLKGTKVSSVTFAKDVFRLVGFKEWKPLEVLKAIDSDKIDEAMVKELVGVSSTQYKRENQKTAREEARKETSIDFRKDYSNISVEGAKAMVGLCPELAKTDLPNAFESAQIGETLMRTKIPLGDVWKKMVDHADGDTATVFKATAKDFFVRALKEKKRNVNKTLRLYIQTSVIFNRGKPEKEAIHLMQELFEAVIGKSLGNTNKASNLGRERKGSRMGNNNNTLDVEVLDLSGAQKVPLM
ncbi:MAG: hypothetical protein CL916_14660, partial [Deltaproteobacteria bacterium]|nr:hypothetical protein [Deltaproteobacteria bacterium]